MDYDKLTAAIDIFYKKATLVSDMAHRIMFGLVKSDTFDLPAARWVASGAKKIIINGMKACFSELAHSYNENKKTLDSFADTSDNPIDDALEYASDEFRKKEFWDPSYGGEPWANIADTLKIIQNLYSEWKRSEKDTDKEEELLKKIIIYLNKFDGMAHNTGTIFNNLIKEEYGRDYSAVASQMNILNKLRNLSEAEDPTLTYKAIEPHLFPTLPYKEQISELTKNPDFFKNKTQDIENFSRSIDTIKNFKKSIKKTINCILINYRNINKIDNMLKDIKEIKENPSNIVAAHLLQTCDVVGEAIHNIRFYLLEINHKTNILAKTHKNFININDSLTEYCNFFRECNEILDYKIQTLRSAISTLRTNISLDKSVDKQINEIVEAANTTIDIINNYEKKQNDVIEALFRIQNEVI